jgi:hypothetical protein
MPAIAESAPRAYESEIRLSTGMAIRVREPHDEVVTRLEATGKSGGLGVLTLTREDGTPVHVLAGHVVLIEPRATDATQPAPSAERPQAAVVSPQVTGTSLSA